MSLELKEQSRPVREAFQANYGVSYIENTSEGGKVNTTIQGKMFYESPDVTTMARDQLESMQNKTNFSKFGEYTTSYLEELTSDM